MYGDSERAEVLLQTTNARQSVGMAAFDLVRFHAETKGMSFNVGVLLERRADVSPIQVLSQQPKTICCATPVGDFRICFKDSGSPVSVFWPWPTAFGRVKQLAIQERDDELFQKGSELEVRSKKVLLVEGTADTRTLVRLTEVSRGSWIYTLNIQRGEL